MGGFLSVGYCFLESLMMDKYVMEGTKSRWGIPSPTLRGFLKLPHPVGSLTLFLYSGTRVFNHLLRACLLKGEIILINRITINPDVISAQLHMSP